MLNKVEVANKIETNAIKKTTEDLDRFFKLVDVSVQGNIKLTFDLAKLEPNETQFVLGVLNGPLKLLDANTKEFVTGKTLSIDDSECTKNNGERLAAFISSISASDLDGLYVRAKLGSLGLVKYLTFLDKIFIKNPNFRCPNLFLENTELDKLTIDEQLLLLTHVAQETNSNLKMDTHVNLRNNTLWNINSEDQERIIINQLRAYPNITLWHGSFHDLLANPMTKEWSELRKIQFLKLYLKVFSIAGLVYKGNAIIPPFVSEMEWYKMLSEFLEQSNAMKACNIFSWLEQWPISEQLTIQLLKKLLNLISQSKHQILSYYVPHKALLPELKWLNLLSEYFNEAVSDTRKDTAIISYFALSEVNKLKLANIILAKRGIIDPKILTIFNFSAETLKIIDDEAKKNPENLFLSLVNSKPSSLTLDTINWNDNIVTRLLKLFQENSLDNLSQLKIDLSNTKEQDLLFIIQFINKIYALSKSHQVTLIVAMSNFAQNPKKEVEELVGFLHKIKVTDLNLELSINFGTSAADYQIILKEGIERNPHFRSIKLTLNQIDLERMSWDEQAILLLYIVKIKSIKHLIYSNNLWSGDISKVKKLLDALSENCVEELVLWYNYGYIINSSLAAHWDNSRKHQFLKLYLMNQTFNDNTDLGFNESDVSFLSEKEKFELLLEFINFGKRPQKLCQWLNQFSLNEDTRFQLAKRYVEINHSTELLMAFNLRPEKKFELYLFSISVIYEMVDKDDFRFKETNLPIKSIIEALTPNIDNLDITELFRIYKEKCLPNCIRACQKLWSPVTTITPAIEATSNLSISKEIDENVLNFSEFYLPLIAKLKSIELEQENFQKLILLQDWMIATFSYLLQKPKSTVVQKSKLIEIILKEMIELPDIRTCYKLMLAFFSSIWDFSENTGLKILENLLTNQISDQIVKADKAGKKEMVVRKTWTTLLGIPLCQIVLGANEKEAKDCLTRAKILINQVPSRYKQGHYFKTLISTFVVIAELKQMNSQQKLSILESILGKRETSRQQVKPDKKALDEAILQARKNKEAQKHVQSAKEKYKQQMSRWILLQGLAALNEVEKLKITTDHEMSHNISEILSKILKLEKEHVQRYQNIFSGLRNEGALLVYLSKIRTLPFHDRIRMESLFQEFIHSVLSPKQKTFVEKRYSTENSSHLFNIFFERNVLRDLWQWGDERDLEAFIDEKLISERSFKVNFQKFVASRIIDHNHMAPLNCQWLKSYLDAANQSDKEKIKAAMDKCLFENSKSSKETDENLSSEIRLKQLDKQKNNENKAINQLSLERELITLIEASEKDKSIQIKSVNTLIRQLNKIGISIEFSNDLRILYRKLMITESRQNSRLKGWKIVDTDHFWDMFMSGTDVQGSCQRVDGDAKLNKCLMAYVIDGKNRMLAIKDPSGKIQARAILRILLDTVTRNPILFLEEIYPLFAPSVFSQALKAFAEERAKTLNLPLVLSQSDEEVFIPYPHPIESLGSPAAWEYVDALHGSQETGKFTITKAISYFTPLSQQPLIERIHKLNKALNNSLIASIIAGYACPTSEDRAGHEKFITPTWNIMAKDRETQMNKTQRIESRNSAN